MRTSIYNPLAVIADAIKKIRARRTERRRIEADKLRLEKNFADAMKSLRREAERMFDE